MHTIAAHRTNVHSLSLIGSGRMDSGPGNLAMVSPASTKSSCENGISIACALDGKSLAHDWAAASNNLKVAHGAATRGRLNLLNTVAGSASGQRAKSGGGCFVQKRAHRARLAEKGLHGDCTIGGGTVGGGCVV